MAAQKTRCAFQGGEIVQLLHDSLHLNLKAGDQGYVWGVYDTDPPTYEADFYRRDASGVAMMFEATEVALISDPRHVNVPQEVLDIWKSAKDAKLI